MKLAARAAFICYPTSSPPPRCSAASTPSSLPCGHFEPAAIAVFIAMVLDGLDGQVARLTHTESEFGAQYDSMADLVSFGLAPALIMYEWALGTMAENGTVLVQAWLAGGVFTW